MFLRLLLSTLMALPLHGMQPQSQVQPPIAKVPETVETLDPQSTIVAFDLDEVVLNGREAGYTKWATEHPQFSKAMQEVKTAYKNVDKVTEAIIQAHPEMKELAEEFKKPIINANTKDITEIVSKPEYKQWLTEHPQFNKAIEEAKKILKLSDAHAIINKAVEEHPEMKELGEEFKKVIITAPQIQGTIDIIHALAKKGYGIVAASNMTESTYKSMVDNKVLPAEFTKEFFFVSVIDANKKSDGSYYEKPAIEYYENLLKYIESKRPGKFKTVIFTDDKKANADGAAATGKIKAIHFVTPAQFKSELQKLGVAIE